MRSHTVTVFSLLLVSSVGLAAEVKIAAFRTPIRAGEFRPRTMLIPNYTSPQSVERDAVHAVVADAWKNGTIRFPKIKDVVVKPFDPFTEAKSVERAKGRFANWWKDDCLGSEVKAGVYVGVCVAEFLVGSEEELKIAESETFVSGKFRRKMPVIVSYDANEKPVVEVIGARVSSYFNPEGPKFFTVEDGGFIAIGPIAPLAPGVDR